MKYDWTECFICGMPILDIRDICTDCEEKEHNEK